MSYPPSHPAYRGGSSPVGLDGTGNLQRVYHGGGPGDGSGGAGGSARDFRRIARERYFSRLWRLQPEDPAMLSYFEEKAVERRAAEAAEAAAVEEASVANGGYYDGSSSATETRPLLSEKSVPSGTVPHRDVTGVSAVQVSVNIIKCAVGAGSFSVPYAFYLEGFWGGIGTTVVLGALAAHTICILAAAEKYCVRNSGTTKRFTYPEVARAIFPGVSIGGVNLLEVLVYAGMCLSSIGVCSVYVVFILQTFPTVVAGATVEYMSLALGPVMLALALVRSYKYLAFTSVLGDVAVTCGIAAAVAFGFQHHTISTDLPAFRLEGVPQAASTLAFLFLIHAIVLPMAQSLKGDMLEPKKFERIAWFSHTFITLLNLAFGMLCYMLFQGNIQPNVIANLDDGTILQIVRVLLCVDLLFTVPMVLAFGREILENSLFAMSYTKHLTEKHPGLTRFFLRAFLVAAVVGTGVGMVESGGGDRAFGNLIQLVGGVFSFLLGFILPPLFHISISRREGKLTVLSALFHGFICALGCVLLASSTYFTILDMISGGATPSCGGNNNTSANCSNGSSNLSSSSSSLAYVA